MDYNVTKPRLANCILKYAKYIVAEFLLAVVLLLLQACRYAGGATHSTGMPGVRDNF